MESARTRLELFLDEAADEKLVRILCHILEEGEKAQIKHGPPSPNVLRGTCIEAEEIGEAVEAMGRLAQAALKLTSLNDREREGQPVSFWLEELRNEWIQIGSVAVRQIMNIDSGRTMEWLLNNQIQS